MFICNTAFVDMSSDTVLICFFITLNSLGELKFCLSDLSSLLGGGRGKPVILSAYSENLHSEIIFGGAWGNHIGCTGLNLDVLLAHCTISLALRTGP